MRILKKFFENGASMDESFVPRPTQTVPGLEPIVVHAVEHLCPSRKEQEHAIAFLLKHTKENEVLDQLSLVRMGIKNIEKIMKENPSLTIRYAIYSENGFTTLKAATKWVRSITGSSQ